MSAPTYRAFEVQESDAGFKGVVTSRAKKSPPPGAVLIRVRASSINYKDFLSATGNKGVTKTYPHIPGIDAAGVVEESAHPLLPPGEAVLVTGYDLGMNTDGGWGEYITVPHQWVVKKPIALSFNEAMTLGTAGFTAAQSVAALTEKIPPPATGQSSTPQKVIVSGASGGVGCIAVALLAKLGYHPIALSRKKTPSTQQRLRELGATEIIDHTEWLTRPAHKRPLARPVCAAAIDTVGGITLTHLLKLTGYRGVVTCCGMVGGTAFESSVFPFILRGVSLVGIDSAECPLDQKQALWEKLAGEWSLPSALLKSKTIELEDINHHLPLFNSGAVTGRLVIKHRP